MKRVSPYRVLPDIRLEGWLYNLAVKGYLLALLVETVVVVGISQRINAVFSGSYTFNNVVKAVSLRLLYRPTSTPLTGSRFSALST